MVQRKIKHFNQLILIAAILFTGLLIYRTFNADAMLTAIKGLNSLPLVIGIVLMLVYVLLEVWMMHLLIGRHKSRPPIRIAFKSTVVGQYYSLITPFASGGQPMQLAAMVEDGVKGHHATAVLVNKFLYFQVGVSLYAIVLSLLNLKTVGDLIAKTFGLIGFGLAVNFTGLTLFVLLIINPGWVKHLAIKLIRIFARNRKDEHMRQQKEKRWLGKIDQTADAIHDMLLCPRLALKMGIMTFLQLTAYFGITFCIYKAFGFSGFSFLQIVTLQALLYLSISLLPSPGSAGVAEGGFHWLFGAVFTSGTLVGAMLIWRGISYYLTLIVSGLLTFFLTLRKRSYIKNPQCP